MQGLFENSFYYCVNPNGSNGGTQTESVASSAIGAMLGVSNLVANSRLSRWVA